MTYYKVKLFADNKYWNPRLRNGEIYIADELYTPKEVEKHNLNMDYLEEVNVSRKKTYWFFGARFAFA